MVELKNCPICDKEKWYSLDYLRDYEYWYVKDYRYNEPVGFKICKECGFVTYDIKPFEELKELYNNERKIVTAQNIITCNRKLEYHRKFLDGCIEDHMKCLDVGCAQGYMAELFTENGVNKDNMYGTEMCDAFRAYADNVYSMKVSVDVDESVKYDFISYYHVLEHIYDPGKELEKVNRVLADNGLLYISVPIFFDELDESSGVPAYNFEEYYHLNHCNCFTKISFKNLLRKHGFVILKEDSGIYAYTVLVKRGKSDWKFQIENYDEITKTIEAQKKAIELVNQKKFDEAIAICPKYPDAYIGKTMQFASMKNFDECKDYITRGLEIMPNNSKLIRNMGMIHYQWSQNDPKNNRRYSNNIKEAEKWFTRLDEMKGMQEEAQYFKAMIEGNYKMNYDIAQKHAENVMRLNPSRWTEMNNYIGWLWKDKSEIGDK